MAAPLAPPTATAGAEPLMLPAASRHCLGGTRDGPRHPSPRPPCGRTARASPARAARNSPRRALRATWGQRVAGAAPVSAPAALLRPAARVVIAACAPCAALRAALRATPAPYAPLSAPPSAPPPAALAALRAALRAPPPPPSALLAAARRRLLCAATPVRRPSQPSRRGVPFTVPTFSPFNFYRPAEEADYRPFRATTAETSTWRGAACMCANTARTAWCEAGGHAACRNGARDGSSTCRPADFSITLPPTADADADARPCSASPPSERDRRAGWQHHGRQRCHLSEVVACRGRVQQGVQSTRGVDYDCFASLSEQAVWVGYGGPGVREGVGGG